MNEMKHFFTTASTDTIGECLSGEKLLNASRDAKGNTLLTVTRSSGPRPSTTTRP